MSLRSHGSVHPRSRGEHAPASTNERTRDGSSPLARGTRGRSGAIRNRYRFIPARAGNTFRPRTTTPRGPVHPRSRGEHVAPISTYFPAAGSSPLARGTHRRGRDSRVLERFIPARAGNTARFRSSPFHSPVHPRSRGEHRLEGDVERNGIGSSPLARGTLLLLLGQALVERFIPARAGNTMPPALGWRSRTVHPRSRGEHFFSCSARRSLNGSSPLARGTLPASLPALLHPRFIPARAGNTSPTAP